MMQSDPKIHEIEPVTGHLAESRCVRSTLISTTRRRFGTAVMETILVLPLLLGLTLAVGEYGMYFYMKHNLVNAARTGGRAAIPAGASNTSVTDSIKNALSTAGMTPSNTSLGNYTVSIKNAAGTETAVNTFPVGTDMYVTISASWDTVGLHLIPRFLGGISTGKTISATAVMRKEAT